MEQVPANKNNKAAKSKRETGKTGLQRKYQAGGETVGGGSEAEALVAVDEPLEAPLTHDPRRHWLGFFTAAPESIHILFQKTL